MITKTLTALPYVIAEPMLVVRDAPREPVAYERASASDILERYYNDIYKLLLAKLADFDRASTVMPAEAEKLQALVAELVKVKSQLETGISVVT